MAPAGAGQSLDGLEQALGMTPGPAARRGVVRGLLDRLVIVFTDGWQGCGQASAVGGGDVLNSAGQALPEVKAEAVAFAGHYDFDVDVLAAYRPQGKGRVERQVSIVRDHVLAGRAFFSIEQMNAAFAAWVPLRRAKVHGAHREVTGHRAIRDHTALRPLPRTPYAVAQRHVRHVGKDCLVAFDAHLYSVPAAGSARASWSRSGPRSS
ncbi:hypothetical protein YW3DRAFT_06546 [Streptomyces sp. MnatMP-M77]|nr:hypothetical protein YW3DRAFT_06546 [Streptomyces sp. MnatMP-M77]